MEKLDQEMKIVIAKNRLEGLYRPLISQLKDAIEWSRVRRSLNPDSKSEEVFFNKLTALIDSVEPVADSLFE